MNFVISHKSKIQLASHYQQCLGTSSLFIGFWQPTLSTFIRKMIQFNNSRVLYIV
jgi:hypothetical protein